MNLLKSKFLTVKFVSFFLICITISSFVLAHGVAYTVNSYLGEVPTIDGIIDEQEEQGTGKPIKMTLPKDPWDQGAKPVEMDIKLGTSHSNDSYLYINTVVNYKKIFYGYMMYCLRRSGTINNFDMKRVSSETEECFDGFRNSSSSWRNYHNDTYFGGTEDSEGICTITEKDITFELRMPFNSGDLAGNDVTIEVGDVLEIELIFHFRYNIDDFWYGFYIHDSITITIQNTTATAPIPRIGIALGLMLVIGITIRRKWKKKNNQ